MTTLPKLGIAIDYDQWRSLMREWIDEVAGADHDLKVQMEWTLESFLQWAKRRRGTPQGPCSACGDGDTAMKYHNHDDNNLLTFRIEKGTNR